MYAHDPLNVKEYKYTLSYPTIVNTSLCIVQEIIHINTSKYGYALIKNNSISYTLFSILFFYTMMQLAVLSIST